LRIADAASWAIWTICAASIGGVLTRARGISEWIYALAGALLLALLGLVSPHDVLTAVGRGTDVYLFLAGMMVLAELARREGVFDWIASYAVNAARGSRWRLFCLVYLVGIIVTTVLSNDATAVVLTPAVAASVRKANAAPFPHLLACAFIANAASFVLPISNPANLVVFANHMPPLVQWLSVFALPSLLAICMTFLILAFVTRRDLRGDLATDVAVAALSLNGRITLGGITLAAAGLIGASALGAQLGLTTFAAAALVFLVLMLRDRTAGIDVARAVSWSVLILVAGLFVLVQGMEVTGLLAWTRHELAAIARWPAWLAVLGVGGTTGLASNAINNLPAGLIAGSTIAGLPGHPALRAATAIGIDLGPNLSVTGSLATVLWLIALRREKIVVSGWSFLCVGVFVMPSALIVALESLTLTAR
jgi:arsenical pump membrane protein